jgi:hypothetical protein
MIDDTIFLELLAVLARLGPPDQHALSTPQGC